MYCDCVRVVQSNLTALYLFFLFLFLFVMYVYISCKVWRKFTESDEIFLSVVSLTIIFSCLRVVQKFKTTTEILTLRHTFSSCYIEIRIKHILCCRCHDINSKRRRRRKTEANRRGRCGVQSRYRGYSCERFGVCHSVSRVEFGRKKKRERMMIWIDHFLFLFFCYA